MPLPMVHLSVAKNLLDTGIKLSRLSQYYLGSISPDAIHARKDTDTPAKRITHLIPADKKWTDVDEAEYLVFMRNFIETNKDKTDIDFLCGYAIHILTDMYWVKQVYTQFIEDYKKDPSSVQNDREAYYNDTDRLDQVLFNESSWKNTVWQSLQTAECSDFLDLLTAREIETWNKRTLHWYDSGESKHKNPIKYITKSCIVDFISSCSETIWKNFYSVYETVKVN